MTLETRLRNALATGTLELPLPGSGATALRHRKLADLARVDLPLARLAESHTDAMAILAEAGREGSGIYGVWASETAGMPLRLDSHNGGLTLNGAKMFCTGAGLVDRALISVGNRMLDVDLRRDPSALTVDCSSWKTSAFTETQTATVTFSNYKIDPNALIGEQNWYLERPGFWHGACGPAACWAGGAMGLVDYAMCQTRDDSHTLAHLGAMHADLWALTAYLDKAGDGIDAAPEDAHAGFIRALTVRHLVEQAAVDILRRLGRAYGPRILAFNEEISKRYQEVELYIRQSHAERDLETLGRRLMEARSR